MARERQTKNILHCPKGALHLESESNSPGGRGVWFARVPAEHEIDDVLSPYYFGLHIHEKGLRVGDIIEIEPEHALWCIRARVMGVVPSVQQIKTRELVNMRQSYQVKAPAGYSFKWLGANGKWAIMRGEMPEPMDAGFDSQDEALARIEELQREKAA